MLPICLTLNKFNTSTAGSVEYEDSIGICISIYLDMIWMAYGISIDNFIIALSETLSHEVFHDLLTNEGISNVVHHRMIDSLHLGLFGFDMRKEWYGLYKERVDKLDKNAAIAYA